MFVGVNIEHGSVIYSSHVPEVTVFQESTTKSELEALLSQVILTKSHDWSYENEYRFFGIDLPNAIKFVPTKLKAIVVGRRMVDSEVERTKKAIEKYNNVHDANVRLLFAHRRATTYQLGIDSNLGFRNSCETNMSARIPVLPNLDTSPITSINDYEK